MSFFLYITCVQRKPWAFLLKESYIWCLSALEIVLNVLAKSEGEGVWNVEGGRRGRYKNLRYFDRNYVFFYFTSVSIKTLVNNTIICGNCKPCSLQQ